MQPIVIQPVLVVSPLLRPGPRVHHDTGVGRLPIPELRLDRPTTVTQNFLRFQSHDKRNQDEFQFIEDIHCKIITKTI